MDKIRKLQLLIISFLICTLLPAQKIKDYPIKKIGDINYYVYKVKKSEGLYSIARKFGITTEDVRYNNPILKKGKVKVHQKIYIPVKLVASYHNQRFLPPRKNYYVITIKKGETLYALSKRYQTTVAKILKANIALTPTTCKEGRQIYIPKNRFSSNVQLQEKNTSIDLGPVFDKSTTDNAIDIALILPLISQTKNNASSRFLEFYEGFLLALEDLKKENISVNLHVFDTGNPENELADLFHKEAMKEMDLIIGPVDPELISVTSDFAERNDIVLVLPFTSTINEVKYNPTIFQVNTPQTVLYETIVQQFCQLFSESKVTFLEIEEMEKFQDKTSFTNLLKEELTAKNIDFQELCKPKEEMDSLIHDLSVDKENVIVPPSGNRKIIKELLPYVRSCTQNDSVEIAPITLFGYPEWQVEKEDFETFYNLNTFIYSAFYHNVFDQKANKFSQRFNFWYSKNLLQTYPKYSLLGYDTGLFFVKALQKYGRENLSNIAHMQNKGIQSDFKFYNKENKGYLNYNIFFIHFQRDYIIQKIRF